MSGSSPISVDLALLRSIANKCKTSSTNLETEAKTMRDQVQQLQNAVRGVPRIAAEDELQQLNKQLKELSATLENANKYVTSMVTRVEKMVEDFKHGR